VGADLSSIHVNAKNFLIFLELFAIEHEDRMIGQRAWTHSHSEEHEKKKEEPNEQQAWTNHTTRL
jgi:hypothetical protein